MIDFIYGGRRGRGYLIVKLQNTKVIYCFSERGKVDKGYVTGKPSQFPARL